MYPIKLLVLIASVVIAKDLNPPLVRTAYGPVRGSWGVSTRGRLFASFEGVPYAAPPVGRLRFKEPQPLQNWTSELDASKPPPKCLQYDGWMKQFLGDEDCLYVNIFTPILAPKEPLPVVIYIHGGAFMYGAGNRYIYDPVNLMDWDIVYVSINYRLGALGFLSTGDAVVPGNNGLKDQSFALHWIKNNIQAFGGDPDSITLTGNSAGGASVHYHYLSPLSRGTFNRGISYSGSAFNPWTLAQQPLKNARRLASLANCSTSSTQEMVDCLTSKSGRDIVSAQAQMFDWMVHMFTPFTPTIEPEGTRNAFLTQYPLEASQTGDVYKVPLIATVTSEEGLYPAGIYQAYPGVLEDLETRWEQLASNIFEYSDTLPPNLRPVVAAEIKQRYFGDKPVSQETFPQLVQALSDRLFTADIGRLVEEHVLRTGQPTYLARFSYRGEKSLSNVMAQNNENYGVSHADDILHIFQLPGLALKGDDDVRINDILINIIYTYATTGVPKVPGAEWVPVSARASELNFLEISAPDKIEMKTSSDFGNRTFWDSLGFNENYKKINLID